LLCPVDCRLKRDASAQDAGAIHRIDQHLNVRFEEVAGPDVVHRHCHWRSLYQAALSPTDK
jgi:hypothetical protein